MMTCEDAWAEISDNACRLADGTEFWRRTTISRIYYAVYHAVGQAIRFDASRPDSNHRRLLDTLAAGDVSWKRASQRLDRLQRARVTADYYLSRDVTRQDVLNALSHARAVRSLILRVE